MLVKFAEYGPTVNGGKDTAGLGSTSSVLNTNFALAAYFQAYGAYPNKWIMRDGELVNGIVQDEMVDALNGLKDLYDRGALAPDLQPGTLTSSPSALPLTRLALPLVPTTSPHGR